MRPGLFKRYFVTFGTTLLTCTVVLGIALLYFFAKSFTDERQSALRIASERAVEIAAEGYVSDRQAMVVYSTVFEGFRTISENSGGSITAYLTDREGKVIACSEGAECTHLTAISERVRNTAIQRGSFSSAGYFEGFFRQRGSYTYGVPLFLNGELQGFVFVSTPITPLFTHLLDISATFLISACAMMLVAAFIIYYAARRLIVPLSEITNAAKRFGSGDFLARVHVDGSDEIAELAASFNSMADSLTEFESTRRSFVANVSHELRTPMTTIGGYIDGILDKTIPTEREDHYLSIVSDEIKRLSRLTTSLLNITRLEESNSPVETTCCNIWTAVASSLENLERRIVDKKLEIVLPDNTPRFAQCNSDMLHQIVYNLLDNAIKFTPVGGVITLSGELKNGRTLLTVHNTGEGIPPQELSRVFDRFYKTDKSRGLDRSGTGLGLFICKSLALRMDSDLSARSQYGSWAAFTLHLPAAIPDKKRLRESQNQHSTQKKEEPAPKSGNIAAAFIKRLSGRGSGNRQGDQFRN